MLKIKDRITLGVISSLIATAPMTPLSLVLNKLGLFDIYYNYPASIFLPRSKTNTIEGKAVSALAQNITVGFVGVVTTYVLSATGRDKAVLKGVGVGSFFWLAFNGLLYNKALHIKSKKSYSPIYGWALHALFGGLCAFSAAKFGDDSLFPDSHLITTQQKLPLIGNCAYSGNKVTSRDSRAKQ